MTDTEAAGPSLSPRERVLAELDLQVRSRAPFVYVVASEDDRVLDVLGELARRRQRKLFVWSVTTGLRPIGRPAQAIPGTAEVSAGLDDVERFQGAAMFAFLDAHRLLEDIVVQRRIRDLAPTLHEDGKSVVLIGAEEKIPPELRHDLDVVHFPLPDLAELQALVDQVASTTTPVTEQTRSALARSALGLTARETRRTLARAVVADGTLDSDDVEAIIAQKQRLLRRGGAIAFHPTDRDVSDVGGLAELGRWIDERGHALTDEGRAFGLPTPRGLLLVGVQGCGKSLSCKVIARRWRMPLLQLDLGAVYSSYIGSSEQNVRDAIAVAEAMAPCVLWVDEIEKGLAGVGSSDMSDAGTSSRVLSTILTWLQEKSAPVFVAATANRIAGLPPELLRRGRFDEIFFVDLPNVGERSEVLAVHLRRRGRDPARFDLAAGAAASDGFSGAEIEQCVVDALYHAFAAGGDLGQEHLAKAMSEVVPLSRSHREQVDELQRWAHGRARMASGQV